MFAEEDLVGKDQYDAGKHGKQDATQIVKIINLPPILFIHLQRFNFNTKSFEFDKIQSGYEFTPHLDMLEQCEFEEDQTTPQNYQLTGIVMHKGSLNQGHYFVYIKRQIVINGQKFETWVEFNDT